MSTWEIIIGAAIPSIVAAIFAVITWIASRVRVRLDAFLNTQEKREIARIVVRSIEQTVQTLHGQEKLAQALLYFQSLAEERGITISETEAKLLIEAEVNTMNGEGALLIESEPGEGEDFGGVGEV